MHCHLQSHLVGILWFVPEQQCSPHEAVHDFVLKCSFNVTVQELSAVILSLFQQRIGRVVCAAPLSDFGISVGKQKCSLLAEQAVQNHFCSSPKPELFLSLKSHVMNSVFLCCGRNFTGNHCWDLLSPLSARSAPHSPVPGALWGQQQSHRGTCHNSLSHAILSLYLSAGAFRGGRRVCSCFFFPKMKRLIVCQCNYAVVPA